MKTEKKRSFGSPKLGYWMTGTPNKYMAAWNKILEIGFQRFRSVNGCEKCWVLICKEKGVGRRTGGGNSHFALFFCWVSELYSCDKDSMTDQLLPWWRENLTVFLSALCKVVSRLLWNEFRSSFQMFNFLMFAFFYWMLRQRVGAVTPEVALHLWTWQLSSSTEHELSEISRQRFRLFKINLDPELHFP